MARKTQETDLRQTASASAESPEPAGPSLPLPPGPLDDPTMVDRGFQAQGFQNSPEGKYWHETLDRMIATRMWDKLNLCLGQGPQLDRLCIELELLQQIKSTPNRDVNMGTAAQERIAGRPA